MPFYIIDKQEQLNKLGEFDDCFIKFIPFNYNYHPQLNEVSLIYIHPINRDKGYILCIKHNESLSLSKEYVDNWLKNNCRNLFVTNKKEALYYYPYGEKLYDINFIKHIDKVKTNKCLDFYYNIYPSVSNVNCLIPISKHYEEGEQTFHNVKKIIQSYNKSDKIYEFNNNEATNVFFEIENKGISLDKDEYIKYYKENIHHPEYNIKKGKIYTKYNLYTTTGRPSNSFNSINFAALNKENGERSIIIPENDLLLELDISSYHPRLIGEMINYPLPKTNIYEALNIPKQEMFQNLYGGIRNNNPFLLKVKEFINEKWKDNKDAQKLFNHLIQNTETITNIKIIEKIQYYLKNKKTKLILYVYDSFLLDYNKEDGEIIADIQNIIQYPTKLKTGNNYHNLQQNGTST